MSDKNDKTNFSVRLPKRTKTEPVATPPRAMNDTELRCAALALVERIRRDVDEAHTLIDEFLRREGVASPREAAQARYLAGVLAYRQPPEEGDWN
jgi:hypothetical protein